ncbi:MAG: hypothetical protein WBA82_07935 [Castellaniella sp.]|uniref:hypothetical protein n=1 Tax=Castellaniella sp. TaxID=1955812 RepID=UPI003C72B76F
MPDYGVTPAGFVRPRLPEIRVEIIEVLRANLRAKGLPDDIETRPDSVMGVLIDTFADRETALWEMGEGVYYAMYPGSASGTSLDRAVAFSGVSRLAAERSKCYVIVYGLQGTPVPVGAQIRNRVTQSLWETAQAATISALGAADVRLVPTVLNSTTYTVTINSVAYSYTSDAVATIGDILAGLVATLAASPMQVSSDGSAVRLLAVDVGEASVEPSANLAVATLGSRVLAQTIDPIAETVGPGDLDTIVTLVDGWQAVTNLVSGSVGRSTETDAELRRRYQTGVFRFGAATLPSIAPNIQREVSGIRAIKVFQNDTDAVVDGRLPHSLHVVVDGGIEEEIATAIYKYKAAGIDTNGAIEKTVTALEGDQLIRFDRPTPVYVWVKAALTLLPAAEQPFPVDGFELVAESINVTGQAHEIGQDVIVQRFFSGIYQTKGIAEVDLQFAFASDPGNIPAPGDYSAANIAIGDIERAMFDPSRIEVT